MCFLMMNFCNKIKDDERLLYAMTKFAVIYATVSRSKNARLFVDIDQYRFLETCELEFMRENSAKLLSLDRDDHNAKNTDEVHRPYTIT